MGTSLWGGELDLTERGFERITSIPRIIDDKINKWYEYNKLKPINYTCDLRVDKLK